MVRKISIGLGIVGGLLIILSLFLPWTAAKDYGPFQLLLFRRDIASPFVPLVMIWSIALGTTILAINSYHLRVQTRDMVSPGSISWLASFTAAILALATYLGYWVLQGELDKIAGVSAVGTGMGIFVGLTGSFFAVTGSVLQLLSKSRNNS